MPDVVLRSARVVTPDGLVEGDVAIADGMIESVGSDIGSADTEIECDGAWVGPAFVDLHTHLREPGQEWKEDIASGSRAAAAGGFGAIVAMPNTTPPIDAAHVARFVSDRGAEVGLVDVIPSGCITLGREGRTMAHIDDLWAAGVRIFTDDGDFVADTAVLRTAMEYIAALGGVISQHAIDPYLSGAGHMHEGSVSSRLGMYGIPRQADDVAIGRDLALVELTGVRYHIQHISTSGAIRMVRDAKDRGLAVTAEVTPHHLMFDHHDVASTDPDYKMMPPLREHDDREALVAGLVDGTIDIVATDHAPHAALEKEVPFEQAPNGVIGLEWAAAVVNETAGLEAIDFFHRMSVAPAAIAGRSDHGQWVAPGNAANLVVFDPKATWTAETSLSRSRNAPYIGRELKGQVLATIRHGIPVFAVEGDE